MVSPEDMVALHPLLDPTGIVGGLHIPSDGFVLTNHCSVWPTLYNRGVWCVVCCVWVAGFKDSSEPNRR